MEKNNFYENELIEFKKHFNQFKNKKILLYGIGRYTSALLNGVSDYNIIGLLDKDPNNVGKCIAGKEILEFDSAVKRAEVIIINTSESYWEVIFQRIKGCGLDIYYRNGQLAVDKQIYVNNLEIWNSGKTNLINAIDNNEVISFDLYDTLVTRKVIDAVDVFELIARELPANRADAYIFNRKKVLNVFGDNTYSLDDVYCQIKKNMRLSESETKYIKELELFFEKKVLYPRKEMIELFRYAQSRGKKVYIVTDMYISTDYLMNWIAQFGITLDKALFLNSSECGASKKSGLIWEKLKETESHKQILHIGDNIVADVVIPHNYGISTYHILKKEELVLNSSKANILSRVTNVSESIVLGLVLAKLFSNPFLLNSDRGRIVFNDFETFGYCVYGPIIYDFLSWMTGVMREKSIDQILFLDRDCYLIQQDYKLFCEVNSIMENNNNLLPMSRRLIMFVSIENRKDFDEYIKYPYCGIFSDFLFDRFNILADARTDTINEAIINPLVDYNIIYDGLMKYRDEIVEEIICEKTEYRDYLERLNIRDRFMIVDTGYHGNPQMYLTKFLQKDKSVGAYFYADLSEQNECLRTNEMYACFQQKQDETGEFCNLKKKIQLTESIFTAPYGMVRMIKSSKKMCAEKRENQTHFEDRILINSGIQKYIKDRSQWDVDNTRFFSDTMFGDWTSDNGIFGTCLKDSLYIDDGMVQRRDIKIFE